MAEFSEGTPTVTIDLDKPRTLAFTIGAMRRARQLGVLDKDATSEVEFMLALPEYVWACLPEVDRGELSVAQIGELIHPRNVAPIASKVGELLRASVPDPNVDPPAVEKPTGGPSTSTSSGQLASTTSG